MSKDAAALSAEDLSERAKVLKRDVFPS